MPPPSRGHNLATKSLGDQPDAASSATSEWPLLTVHEAVSAELGRDADSRAQAEHSAELGRDTGSKARHTLHGGGPTAAHPHMKAKQSYDDVADLEETLLSRTGSASKGSCP